MLSILERLRKRVEQGDWRNHLVGKDMTGWKSGPGCLIQLLAQEGDSEFVALDAVGRAIYSKYESGIMNFNDNPKRTIQEVLDIIDLTIKTELQNRGVQA